MALPFDEYFKDTNIVSIIHTYNIHTYFSWISFLELLCDIDSLCDSETVLSVELKIL